MRERKAWFLGAGMKLGAGPTGPGGSNGFALLEFAVALLLFSLAMWGVLSAQTVARSTSYAALQRTVALSMVQDLITRVRANPASVQDYAGAIPAEGDSAVPTSVADCYSTVCNPRQLARFDLHEWRSGLAGHWENKGDLPVGSLLLPSACVVVTEGAVEVWVSWVALTRKGSPGPMPCTTAQQHAASQVAARQGREFLRFRIALGGAE